jgi:predicted transcriptional regulator YheO
MRKIKDDEQFYKQLLDMLESELGCDYELILHDLTLDYDHTIVDIRNGHITNRKVGDCGNNLGLEVLRGTVENGDRYNYVTHTNDGKILRSSTMFIKGDDGDIIGSLCINKNITFAVQMEEYLHQANNYPLLNLEEKENIGHTNEVFVNNVGELMDYFLQEGLKYVGKQARLMNREDKCQFVKYLDDKGAFIISKASERVCEFLGISRFTLYNYLDAVRNGNEDKAGKTAEM